ncbi:uncharacterized protein V1518DRAFT_182640 [Limtongia smithiae]|uniref:uncharacterized protein n=1 Tax=Limtongia smithiae TaxID=1125753 RepID=UPI0034CECF00
MYAGAAAVRTMSASSSNDHHQTRPALSVRARNVSSVARGTARRQRRHTCFVAPTLCSSNPVPWPWLFRYQIPGRATARASPLTPLTCGMPTSPHPDSLAAENPEITSAVESQEQQLTARERAVLDELRRISLTCLEIDTDLQRAVAIVSNYSPAAGDSSEDSSNCTAPGVVRLKINAAALMDVLRLYQRASVALDHVASVYASPRR